MADQVGNKHGNAPVRMVRRCACSILILLLLPFFAQGQQNLPELLSKIEEHNPDSLKADGYFNLGTYYLFSQPDSARYYAETGLKYFTGKNYKPGIAWMLLLHGNIDEGHGSLNIAANRLHDALEIFTAINDRVGIGNVNNALGIIEGKRGNYPEAAKLFMSALNEGEKANNEKLIATTYIKLGVLNELNNNLDKALEYYNASLKIAEKDSLYAIICQLYNNIGIVYAKKRDLETPIRYFNMAFEKSKASPQLSGITIDALTNLGICYDNIGRRDVALGYLQQALDLTKDRNLPEQNARILTNMGGLFIDSDPAKALPYLQKALEMSDKIGHVTMVKSDILRDMKDDYARMGKYKEALMVMEQKKALDDSLFNISKVREIDNLQSLYELKESNAKIAQLELSKLKDELQRNLIILFAIALVIIVVTLTYAYDRTRRLNKKISKREKELRNANNIKDRLFSIIGHDLRGPAGNVTTLIDIIEDPGTPPDDRKEIIRSLKAQSAASFDTLDKLLLWGSAQIKGITYNPVSFAPDHNVKSNINLISAIADQKQITITDQVPPGLCVFADPAHFDFVIRNLISNAVKFTHNNGRVTVSADTGKEPGFIIFSVADNGIGIDKAYVETIFHPSGTSAYGTANERGTSIGLMLCREFIKENGGSIWVESEKGKGSVFYFSVRSVAAVS